jgi:hypothetical protein
MDKTYCEQCNQWLSREAYSSYKCPTGLICDNCYTENYENSFVPGPIDMNNPLLSTEKRMLTEKRLKTALEGIDSIAALFDNKSCRDMSRLEMANLLNKVKDKAVKIKESCDESQFMVQQKVVGEA